MRHFILFILNAALLSCAGQEVKILNLRDPRLPLEARRWLADAEDEVAVATARVDDADQDQQRFDDYLKDLLAKVDNGAIDNDKRAGTEGRKVTASFHAYAEAQRKLSAARLEAAKIELALALSRLTLARAETAVRYDLAVYELTSIVSETESLRKQVAALERAVEEHRIDVEKKADALWDIYGNYVKKGGTTNALWASP